MKTSHLGPILAWGRANVHADLVASIFEDGESEVAMVYPHGTTLSLDRAVEATRHLFQSR